MERNAFLVALTMALSISAQFRSYSWGFRAKQKMLSAGLSPGDPGNKGDRRAFFTAFLIYCNSAIACGIKVGPAAQAIPKHSRRKMGNHANKEYFKLPGNPGLRPI